jgi:hypothetical protein
MGTKLTVGLIITMLALTSGVYFISQDDDAYSCNSKGIVTICDKLSSGLGTRCYSNSTYTICPEGWIKLNRSMFLDNLSEKEVNNVKQYSCNQVNCTEIV